MNKTKSFLSRPKRTVTSWPRRLALVEKSTQSTTLSISSNEISVTSMSCLVKCVIEEEIVHGAIQKFNPRAAWLASSRFQLHEISASILKSGLPVVEQIDQIIFR